MCFFEIYLLHSLPCLDVLDAVIVNPLEMVAEAVAKTSDKTMVILSSFSGVFKGVEGTRKQTSVFRWNLNHLCVCRDKKQTITIALIT